MKTIEVVVCENFDCLIPLEEFNWRQYYESDFENDIALANLGTRGYCSHCSFFEGYDEQTGNVICEKEE